MAETLGTENPIRYRGYYYDNETGFYYLQSRYYDPETGRFLNADGELARAGGILVLQNGKCAIVEKIQHELLKSPIKVYNFEIAGFHTYFVGDSSILVHNGCKPHRR